MDAELPTMLRKAGGSTEAASARSSERVNRLRSTSASTIVTSLVVVDADAAISFTLVTSALPLVTLSVAFTSGGGCGATFSVRGGDGATPATLIQSGGRGTLVLRRRCSCPALTAA